MNAKVKLLEADITGQVKDFLTIRGWRAIRHQRFVVPGAGQSGEPGIPDFCFIKYMANKAGEHNGLALVLWVELKRPNARPQCRCNPGRKSKCTLCAQKAWRAREEARGAIVVQVSDITDFKEWYIPRFAWSDTQKGLW